MNVLEVLIGMIGSGKSRYARDRADGGALVVSHDDLTAMLHTRPRYEQELRAVYREAEEAIVMAAMKTHKVIVIDRTHLTLESRQRWVNLAHKCGYTAKAVVFPVLRPHVHAFRRWQSEPRGRSFEEWFKVAEHHADQIKAEPLDTQAEGFDQVVCW